MRTLYVPCCLGLGAVQDGWLVSRQEKILSTASLAGFSWNRKAFVLQRRLAPNFVSVGKWACALLLAAVMPKWAAGSHGFVLQKENALRQQDVFESYINCRFCLGGVMFVAFFI